MAISTVGAIGSAPLAEKAQRRRARVAIFGGTLSKILGRRTVSQKRKRFAVPLPKRPPTQGGLLGGVSTVGGLIDDDE